MEDNIIRFAVKVILLWKNKDITTQELMKTLPYLRAVWSNLIDFCEMSFAYDPATLAKNAHELVECFVKLVQQARPCCLHLQISLSTSQTSHVCDALQRPL